MKRLSRPLLFTLIAVVAHRNLRRPCWEVTTPIDVKNISGWLRAADPVDGVAAELGGAVAGLLLAVYVALVSAVALVAEMVAILGMPRLARATVGWSTCSPSLHSASVFSRPPR